NMAAKKITKERIEEVARMVGLEKAIHHKVKTYSLGMRQRLGIAQAILHEPSLLILDEPTNGLDPQGIKEVRDYLRALAKAGTAVIVSSHLLSEMQLMCDRFAIIEKGKLIQISSIADLNGGKKEGQKVIFEVDDAKTAILILRRNDWAKEDQLIDQQQFSVKLAKEDVAKANRLLVNRGVKVYGIRTETTTLEDHFLKLTGNGEEGGMSRAAAN
ncbi:MAG: ABC transporter ATP-binding protein, partial [Bacillales bacterium]